METYVCDCHFRVLTKNGQWQCDGIVLIVCLSTVWLTAVTSLLSLCIYQDILSNCWGEMIFFICLTRGWVSIFISIEARVLESFFHSIVIVPSSALFSSSRICAFASLVWSEYQFDNVSKATWRMTCTGSWIDHKFCGCYDWVDQRVDRILTDSITSSCTRAVKVWSSWLILPRSGPSLTWRMSFPACLSTWRSWLWEIWGISQISGSRSGLQCSRYVYSGPPEPSSVSLSEPPGS